MKSIRQGLCLFLTCFVRRVQSYSARLQRWKREERREGPPAATSPFSHPTPLPFVGMNFWRDCNQPERSERERERKGVEREGGAENGKFVEEKTWSSLWVCGSGGRRSRGESSPSLSPSPELINSFLSLSLSLSLSPSRNLQRLKGRRKQQGRETFSLSLSRGCGRLLTNYPFFFFGGLPSKAASLVGGLGGVNHGQREKGKKKER